MSTLMANQESLWREFTTLPADEQAEVADFISFLHSRQKRIRRAKPQKNNDILSEPFIGMWKDRQDLTDSSAWVRATRQREWTRNHG